MRAFSGGWRVTASVTIAFILILGQSAPAATVDIGGGWSATWDASFDAEMLVDVIGLSVSQDGTTVFIRKEAEFRQPPPPFGVFPSIPIVFRQTAIDAATSIVIEEEIIMNETGVDWSGFVMTLLDEGDANFNPAATDGSGFTFGPFTVRSFTEGDMKLNLSQGTVSDGTTWTPGGGSNTGQIWIDAFPNNANFTQFVLKETPLPEPPSLALLVMMGPLIALVQRRRRAIVDRVDAK